jgi:DNA-binding PucR family transcriptional regulator
MLLSDLLDAPRLGLHVLHAEPEALGEPVGRLVTTDLLEPGRYLNGGELVLTGLVWRRTPADSETFVASVAGRGARTILAGTAQLGGVPDDLLEACRHHGVTLVEVPIEVAFADVTEHVAAVGAAGSGARLSASLVRQRELLSSIASGRSLDELAARVSSEIGHECRFVTPTGQQVVPGAGGLDDKALDAITRRFLTSDRLPTVAEAGDTSYSLFAVGSGLSSRLTAWLLVVEGNHTDWPRDHVEAVHELCAIAALDRARRDERLRALRPVAAGALALVESGGPPTEVAARLREAGLDPDRPLVVAVAEGVGEVTQEATATLLEDVAQAVGPPVVAPGRDAHLVALLPAAPEVADLLRRALGRLSPGLSRARLAVGISGETGVDALAGALEEARFAHRMARAATLPVSVVGSDEVTSHVLLLATVPDDVRRTYAHRVLGPVLEHDERTHGELVATLSEFLASSGSWARTAEALHLHVNTVRYRIEKVQELTGRDLARLEDRVDVFLALRSL